MTDDTGDRTYRALVVLLGEEHLALVVKHELRPRVLPPDVVVLEADSSLGNLLRTHSNHMFQITLAHGTSVVLEQRAHSNVADGADAVVVALSDRGKARDPIDVLCADYALIHVCRSR